MQPYQREPEYVTTLADGTVKQLNPFTGTEVWTVPGRGNRPLGGASGPALPLDPDADGAHCAFCEKRYLETPPEKSRVVHRGNDTWETHYRTPADELHATTAAFRRIPNLFEILSYEYWHLNYGYALPSRVAARREAYLASPAGWEHVRRVVAMKLRAAGLSDAQLDALGRDEVVAAASGFFGGGHDLIVARRHYVDGATDTTQLASSGTLSVQEHREFIRFTVESVKALYELNRYARYVTVFQNWLKPAGASFDHLHKQLVAIDERGVQHEATLAKLRQNPNLFNDVATNYAARKNLVIAENDHAIAFAGFGHRFPTIEIYSTSPTSDPWELRPEELRGMADMIHAMQAATGADIPCNEEWHYRPIDVDLAMPWRVMLKWRISTLAGFEGATKIYLNTITPVMLRDRVVERLFALRAEHRVADDLKIAFEAPCRPNTLRYARPSR
ncbi:DUF4921 family protein [Propioniciclava soli]|uniref:DUF4921 family protein n=1 Tax=Propioniciclava soli TaxID=2775081 RepID=UPI001E41DE74|nr:DUF4921 family protein [Propioniciclava soli]